MGWNAGVDYVQTNGWYRPKPAGGGGGDAAETTAFLARTSGLDATHTNAYKAMINGLVADAVFSKLDALWVTATADATTAGLNLKSSSFTLTNNSATFTADAGYGGNGSSQYVNTNFNLSTNGVNFTQNAASLFAWSTKAGLDNGYCIGQVSPGFFTNCIQAENFGAATSMLINGGAAAGAAVADGFGLFTGVRTSSSSVSAYRNAALNNTNAASTSAAPASANVAFLQDTGTFFGGGIAAAGIGGALTATDVSNLYARLHTFLNTVNSGTFP